MKNDEEINVEASAVINHLKNHIADLVYQLSILQAQVNQLKRESKK